jgi:PAS domain S-box-containing protein
VVVTAVDVDAIKRSEQQRGDAERRLRNILDTAAEGIVTIDESGTVLSFNAAAEQLFGYAAAEVVGRNVKMLMPPPYRDQHDDYLRNYLTTGVQKVIGIGRVVTGRRKDGTTFSHKLALSEVREDGRRIFTGIMSDLTDLERAQDRALQAERLAAIGQVSAGLTHESRNALQRSQACLEMLAREVKGNPKATDLIARAQEAQNLLLDLYEQVRSYAAPIVLHTHRCDLGELLGEVWKVLELDREGRTVAFAADPGGVDPHCVVDPAQLAQVFRNLLENALQACPDPAEIRVTWSDAELGGRPALRLALRNNGPPLTPDERARVFEAFFTTKTHGTGLGMTIARRVVESHGGRIEVGPGPAAEFVITLPRGRS